MKRTYIMAVILTLSTAIGLQAQTTGNPAPDFEITLVSSDTFRLSDHIGKTVMVFFFGNRCPSCLGAGPDIEAELYQMFKDNEEFTAVGIDTWNSSSNVSSVTGFQNSTGISFPLGLSGAGIASSYETTYDRLAVIDPQGILVHKGTVLAGNDIETVSAAIQASLGITAGTRRGLVETTLRAYPNPAVEILYLQAGERGIRCVEVFDITGKKVLRLVEENEPPSVPVSVDVSGLKEGVYLYTVWTGNQPVTGKFLVRR